jgi:predicted metal-dependent phosphoesterase TrpH
MNIDFHCHTTASDGSLQPTELLDLAVEQEIDMLSITDHDTLNAYKDIEQPASIQIVPGIELSSQWNRRGVHIVGLNVGLSSPSIIEGVAKQSRARRGRAEKIAEKLERFGFTDCLAGAQSYASGPDQIGRPHFAQHLVNIGAVSSIQQAFKRYLGAGKVGDIKDQWAEPKTVIDWIKDAGGVAVLAHPTKYKLTRSKLIELLNDFKAAGGEAMEVISGSQVPAVTRDMARLCNDIGFEASCGSDFHTPNQQWAALGKVAPLPDNCTPLWHRWQ